MASKDKVVEVEDGVLCLGTSNPIIRNVSRPAVFSHIQGRPESHLTWRDICYSVRTKAGRKEILHSVSGELRPGELTCILGPSGSGKTTLLNLLSGRVGPGGRFGAQISGQMRLNGLPIEAVAQQHLFGYVMQEDSLFATETPREILAFSARLRLRGVSEKEIHGLLEDMIESLGLGECADTMAGNEMIKGISGGQRKRTAIGAELITNPAITFLDEPTSGLDTAAAYKVCSVLKELAKVKQSVMCTIHQPSSEIFQLFDSAIFLARGSVVYQGPPSGIRAHFDLLDFVCPRDYNPADFVMFLVETVDDRGFGRLLEGRRDMLALDAAKAAQEAAVAASLPPRLGSKGFFIELHALMERQLRNVRRDVGALIGRFGLTTFLNIVFGLIFLGAGKRDANYNYQSHMGSLTMIGIDSMFGCTMPAVLSFPSERPVFLREYTSKQYGVVPYFLSKTAVEIVLLFIQVVINWLLEYWMVGYTGQFFVHVAACFLIGLTCSSIGLFLGCSVGDAKLAIELLPLVFVPQMLFAGFFIKLSQIPAFLRWLQYVCALKWGINIAFVNEFDNPLGKPVLDFAAAKPEDVGLNVGILLAIIVGFRILAMLQLRRKARTLYG